MRTPAAQAAARLDLYRHCWDAELANFEYVFHTPLRELPEMDTSGKATPQSPASKAPRAK